MLETHVDSRSMDQANVYGHSRSRNTSSNSFSMQQTQNSQQLPHSYQHPHPLHPHSQHHHQAPGPQHPQVVPTQRHSSRRSPSVTTFSTASSMQPPAAYRTSSSTDLRRSISSRSGGTISQPPGYVALLRRQKATVWCERAQYEDPRVTAQQRAAKTRANLEVVGGGRGALVASRSNTGISTTGKVAAKIRHHGKNPVVGYAPGDTHHVGVGGVPLRLSATEVEGGSDDEDDSQNTSRMNHRRTGSSGRSSIGSGRWTGQYRSAGSVASGSQRRRSPGDTPEQTGSLADHPENSARSMDDAASGRPHSSRSASSGERADSVGELGTVPNLASNSHKHSALIREKSVKTVEALKRRGSVDERTATLTSGRLYIANPD
ncbi:hypothetical protein E4U22_000765 [Claviceps purpurea]|uniref:Uncharacterized protein n=2 Tax=Claviceps TaxID=5110 RepID=M1W7L7_CLAP2|nr:hypothetical protein E4U12_003993 [Claviceps purpurea]KAG6303183.1 hypothetical protein E4U09_000668 [Claviceps aff. purpurea]CCE28513.1 uncharacterized protein CPUR_02200 [Claviceps purpurea 20.1]KAG6132005.1 hypothetical protein E4U28_006746 [Claviceps purpurea]KAG6132639.1 hypothetical protein E4U38_003205 [Claviceps purpurea]